MPDIFDFFARLFSAEGFIPRWICGEWSDFHGWFYIASDALIWLSYFAIPLILVYFLFKKKDVPFHRVFWWFIAFILFCGLTHLIDVLIFWIPVYRLSALLKAITAVVSIGTVFVLIKYLPTALQAKSPEYLKKEIERKTAELKVLNEKLLLEKIKFETIMNTSSAGLILFDVNGKVEDVNTQALEIFGYNAHEVLNLTINDFLPSEFMGFHAKMMASYLKNPTKRKMGLGRELKAKMRNGKLFPVEIGLSPMKIGSEQKVLATIANIELRKIKEEIKDKQILDFKELNRQLETKNNELEDVSYIVSHNLRSPIQNMKGLLDLVNDDKENFELYKNKFNHLVDRLACTVDDLNAVVQSGREEPVDVNRVNFEEQLNQVIKSLVLDINRNKAEIETDFTVESIAYSATFIQSYLQNLITNAVKYKKPNQHPLITIRTELSADYIVLSCQDNGLGIDLEKHADKLFKFGETFHKHNDSRGVGLYMIKRQIERLGGYIKVESEVGEGTKFLLYLKNQA